MSIVLQGSTSGSITLQEPAVAGSNTINLPAATGTAVLTGVSGNVDINAAGSNNVTLSTNSTERMRIDSSGNVGIGTTSPSNRLQVQADLTSNTEVARFSHNTDDISRGSKISLGLANYPMAQIEGFADSNGNGSLRLYTYTGTTTTEKARIDSSGRVLVGRTTTINNSYKLHVDNGAAGSIVANSTGAGDANFYSTSTGIGYHIYAESTTAKFYVVNAGTIYSTNTAVQAISDIRHKENIKDLETGLAEVLALKPRRFDWKEGCGTGAKNVAGFIAQEVEPILPDLIGDWQNQMGSDEKFKSLAMGNMLPTLVKAIQELKGIVDTQATKIAELEAKLEGTA